MMCPFKPHFDCAATAVLIHQGRCLGCPNAMIEIVNNPWDAFGRKFGYRIDDIAVRYAPAVSREAEV
jgi:hypothetical protein